MNHIINENGKKTNKIALYGVLVALALIFSYVEMLLPVFFFVPGMKLGLTNVVIIVVLYKMGDKEAIIINIVRILLVSILFGNMISMLYSLAGGVLSTVLMICLKRVNIFSRIVVSIVGAIAHNVGQIMVAVILLQTASIWWYMLVLWFTAIVTGFIIGVIGGLVLERIG